MDNCSENVQNVKKHVYQSSGPETVTCSGEWIVIVIWELCVHCKVDNVEYRTQCAYDDESCTEYYRLVVQMTAIDCLTIDANISSWLLLLLSIIWQHFSTYRGACW